MKNPLITDSFEMLDDRETGPLIVVAHPDAVVIVGPQGVTLAMTPEAAIASAEVLIDAAAEAIKH